MRFDIYRLFVVNRAPVAAQRAKAPPVRDKACRYWPASWPAGLWVMPLFWLTVVLLAWLVRRLG